MSTPSTNVPLHDHYARNALACGHEQTCEMVTQPRNWPTICGRPSCTCRVGGNTAEAQIAYRKATRIGTK